MSCIIISFIYYSVIIIEIKHTINVMHLNHPETISTPTPFVEKLSSRKLVPGAKKVEGCCLKWSILESRFESDKSI